MSCGEPYGVLSPAAARMLRDYEEQLAAPWRPSIGFQPLGPSPEYFQAEGRYKRFRPQLLGIATMSSRGTKVGALALGEDNEPLSSGWNDPPRKSNAGSDDRAAESERHLWVVHAEANLIANAARSGAKLKGSTLLVTHPPCLACANLIVQAGIKSVLTAKGDAEYLENWGGDVEKTQRLFDECGVTMYQFDVSEERERDM